MSTGIDFSCVSLNDWVYVESNKYVKTGRVIKISMTGFMIDNVINWPWVKPKPQNFLSVGPHKDAIKEASIIPIDITHVVSHSHEECYLIPFYRIKKLYSHVIENFERDFEKREKKENKNE